MSADQRIDSLGAATKGVYGSAAARFSNTYTSLTSYTGRNLYILWIILIIFIIALAGFYGIYAYLYDKELKNSSKKELSLAVLIGMAIVLAFFIGAIFWIRGINQQLMEEDKILTDLTRVAAIVPSKVDLQDKIGELVHKRLGGESSGFDKNELTDYIFGNSDYLQKRDSNGNVIGTVSAASGGRYFSPAEISSLEAAAQNEKFNMGYEEGIASTRPGYGGYGRATVPTRAPGTIVP